MSQYKMIAIDLDGTLLSPSGRVTERTKQAVQRCLSAGLLICFATGRNWTESKTILDTVEHWPTAVFVGGAMVIDTDKGVTLHRTIMQPALAREVSDCLESFGHAVLALQDTDNAGVDYLISSDLEPNEATRLWMDVSEAKLHMVPRLSTHSHEHTIRVGICATPEEVAVVHKALLDRFGERVVVHNLLVPAFGVEVLEVFDPAVNKWEGIMHVARRHGVLPEQIVAIGDDVNDIPMIRNAGLGVAMGNARPSVQAVARRVIGTNADEGLAAFLDELVAAHAVEPLGPDRQGNA